MIYYLKIVGGVVVNRIVAGSPLPLDWFVEDETWVRSDTAQIGWSYDGEVFNPPPRKPDPEPEQFPPDPIPIKIADLETRISKLEEETAK